MKTKAAEEVGIKFNHVKIPEAATPEQIVDLVKKFSDNDAVSGVLVQLPLGPHVDEDGTRAVTEAISPEKDVDG